MAIIMITHDLGVIAGMCDEVIVMYAGRVCERGTADEIFYHPRHEYTKGLLRSIPNIDPDEKQRAHPHLRHADRSAVHAQGLPLRPAVRPRDEDLPRAQRPTRYASARITSPPAGRTCRSAGETPSPATKTADRRMSLDGGDQQ